MNLNISTGLKSYDLTDENGDVLCTVRFNPTDPTFAQRLYEAFAGLGEKDEQFHQRIVDESDPVKIFGVACEADAEMRKTIDGILGPGTCQAIYGTANVYYARADGLPLWANLLLSIMDEMDDAMMRENKAADPRLAKYVNKFGKKAG
jgi:hypothetical protein